METKKFVATKLSDLTSNFPELAKADKFKKVINDAFKAGFSLDIELSGPTVGFLSASGKTMNCRISRNGKGYFIKVMHTTHIDVTLDSYEKQKERFLSFDPSVSYGKFDGVPIYPGIMVRTSPTSWGELAQVFGKLIKDDMKLVNTCTCTKCGGSGILPRYSHIFNGQCFQCMGVGKWIAPINNKTQQGSKIVD